MAAKLTLVLLCSDWTVSEHQRMCEERLAPLLSPSETLSEEEATRLGKKDPEQEVRHTARQQMCPTCAKEKEKSATSCSFHNKSPSYYPTTDFEIIRRPPELQLITKRFRSSLVFDFTSSNFVFLIIPHQLQENVLEEGSKFS